MADLEFQRELLEAAYKDATRDLSEARDKFYKAGKDEKELSVDDVKDYFSSQIGVNINGRELYAKDLITKNIYDQQNRRYREAIDELKDENNYPSTALSILGETLFEYSKTIAEREADIDEAKTGVLDDYLYTDMTNTQKVDFFEKDIEVKRILVKGVDKAISLIAEKYAPPLRADAESQSDADNIWEERKKVTVIKKAA